MCKYVCKWVSKIFEIKKEYDKNMKDESRHVFKQIVLEDVCHFTVYLTSNLFFYVKLNRTSNSSDVIRLETGMYTLKLT